MKNIFKKLLLLIALIVVPVGVLAEAQFTVTPTSLNIETGKTKTFTITTSDLSGNITITSSNNDVALVSSTGYGFEAGSAGEKRVETITVTGVNPGTARLTIAITATDTNNEPVNLESKTIDVTVKSISTNNNLSSIKINGNLIASFKPSVTTYNIDIEEANVTIVATPEDSGAKVTGDGSKVLKYGNNKIELKVTAESGSVKTYTLNLNRKDTRDSNNDLLDLTIDKGNLTYDKAKTSYEVEVESDVDKVTVNAIPESARAKVSGHGLIKLNYGNNKVEVKVTAENESIKIYTIVINRKDTRDSNNYLSSIRLNKGNIEFDRETTAYDINVNSSVDSIIITATAESEKAVVVGDGEKALSVGANKVEIKVTSETGEVRKYVLTINRAEPLPGEDFIEFLEIGNAEFNFDPSVVDYYITITDQTSLDFNYVLKDDVVATIDGNENLEHGSEVLLTASKGDVSITYRFNIVKEKETVEPKKDKTGGKKWIFIVAGALAVLLIIGTVAKSKDKKKKDVPKKDTDNPLEAVQNEINSELASTEVVSEMVSSIENETPASTETPVENQQNDFENIEKL